MTFSLSHPSTRFLVASAMVVVGVIGRVALVDAPNIEPILALSILAAALLGGRYGMLVAALSVALSDLFIGTHSVMWATWSAWAIIGASAFWLRRVRTQRNAWRFLGASTMYGIGSAVFFYLWTNAAVWLEGTLYARSIDGLIASYAAGLPFLRLHVLSSLVCVPLSIGIYLVATQLVRTYTQHHVRAKHVHTTL